MTAKWKREQLIGQGAFAKVYLVQEWRGGRFLACKVADTAEGMALLAREADILKNISHPLFAEYEDFVRNQNCAMLFMEYIEGESLGKILGRGGGLPQAKAAEIAARLAEGLLYLHELPRPMIYRDLKPDNIQIRSDGRVKLLDMGCVCAEEEARHSIAGSRGYAAPEQMRVGAYPGPYSDVYALGRLLHYMLTGQDPCQPPFRNPPLRTCRPGVSPLLERLVARCTEEEPGRRPPDMRAVLRQLAPFLERNGKLRQPALWMRERAALAGWLLSGRSWEGDFVYEKCIVKSNQR